MQAKWMIIAVLLLALVAAPAPAAQVADLYRAEVGDAELALVGAGDEVLPAGEAERRHLLMRAGLARVLVRVSGTRQVVDDPMVQRRLLDRAESLVSRFQLLGGPDEGPRMRVRFNGEAVRTGLWDSGWPVWGRYRPGLLVWVARRGDQGLRLASPDSAPALFDAVREGARREGLPLVLPLMDGRDRGRLAGRDLLFEDWARIREASARYDPEGVLLLRLAPVEEGHTGEWVLRRGGEAISFRSEGGSVREAVAAGLQEVRSRMARDYAVFPGRTVTMEAVVAGITGLEAFARVERGLARLAAIEGVVLRRVSGEEARFRFAFQGRPEEAGHILELLDTLRRREAPADEAGDRPRLFFSFRP